jgi:hypothetical protein
VAALQGHSRHDRDTGAQVSSGGGACRNKLSSYVKALLCAMFELCYWQAYNIRVLRACYYRCIVLVLSRGYRRHSLYQPPSILSAAACFFRH